jgi:glycosyltransferase involved in cell wall biosynthesis
VVKEPQPKLKILWLAYLDYRSGSAQGGNLRLFNYGREMVSMGHEVYFLVMKRKTDKRTERAGYLSELRRQKVITDYFEIEYQRPMVRRRVAHLLFHPVLTNFVLRKQQEPVMDAIRKIIASRQINLCIFSSRDLIFVLPEIEKYVKTIVDWVDSYFLYHLREAHLHLKEYRPIQAIKSLRFLADSFIEERYYGRRCAYNLTVSPVDKKYLDFANGLPHKNLVLLNGVEAHRAEPCVKVKNRIIFTGNMDFPPNYKSAIWFIDHVFPLLRARSDINLVIAGANPVEELVARAGDRIEVTGYVENLRQEIARSELYVAPLICGGGFKNKVAEAISSGTFVIATSMAVEFFDPNLRKHLLVADTAQQMAGAILAYLQNPQVFAIRLKTLKRIIDEDFTWESKAEEFVGIACEAKANFRGGKRISMSDG